MKRKLLILLFIIFSFLLFAQAPDWQWAAQAGGTSNDYGQAIAIDDAGYSYVTGFFAGTATFGSYTITWSGVSDIFVAKMDASGNWLWVTQAGGSNEDFGWDIAIDDNGNSYVTGFFAGTATFGSYSLTNNGYCDIFVAKMDANGSWLWATKAGGSGWDGGNGITIDDDGNSYVTGSFRETATFGSYSLTTSGDSDIFVAKMGNDTSAENEIIPTKMELSNYPNPFNPTTTISFSLPEDSDVELSIYNVKGQKVRTLTNEFLIKGLHSVIWNGEYFTGKKVSSGIYLYKLKVNGKIEKTKKMLLLK